MDYVVSRFHNVQTQQNCYDCGLYAIAIAVSLCLGENSEKTNTFKKSRESMQQTYL